MLMIPAMFPLILLKVAATFFFPFEHYIVFPSSCQLFTVALSTWIPVSYVFLFEILSEEISDVLITLSGWRHN